MELQKRVDTFLEAYLASLADADKKLAGSYWKAANSGKQKDFKIYAEADLAMRKLHSSNGDYRTIETFMAHKEQLKALSARSLTRAYLSFKGNQLPEPLLEKMVAMSTEIEQIFNNFRAKLDDKEFTNNDLLDKIKPERDSTKREAIWKALKQVGNAIGSKLVGLAKIRNEAARELGFKNYWDMSIRLQEHDPDQIISIFVNLEKETDEPFKQMKRQLDQQLAARFNIEPREMMPWHYDNPFFQDAPPSDTVDVDEFYRHMNKDDVVRLSLQFFREMGLPIEDIVERSDLFEREGKQQHAFCISLDQSGDTRVLTNIKPTAQWMGTMLHEMGHGVYYKNSDFTMPYNLREAAHTFTTEAVAMLMGALAVNPTWLKNHAGADEKRVKEVESDLLEQRRRELLIFARWTLVMLNFEKEMYENPDQDLNKLWWDIKERFQMLKRPDGRDTADWAAKPHFTIAPVYYHNYMLGELFAAQLRNTLLKRAGHTDPAHTLDLAGQYNFGEYFKSKIFQPGSSVPWPAFVQDATGEPLTAKYFAAELKK